MALFNNIEQIKIHTDDTIGVNLHSFLSIQTDVYRKYIAGFLPMPLYLKLENMVPDETVYGILRTLLQATMSKLMVAEYAARSEVSLSSSGLLRTEGNEQKSGYRYQSAAFVRSYRLAGISVLDEILRNCDDNKANIPEWKDSKAAKRYSQMLIKSGAEFSEYLKLKHPQLTYQQLTVDMEDVEFILFSKIFGTNYPILKSRAATGILKAEEEQLLEFLKRTMANAAMQRAVPKLAISIEDDGIMSVALDDAQDKNANKVPMEAIVKYQQSVEATANEYMALSKAAFDTVIDTADPGIYVSAPTPATTSSALLDNSGFSSLFVM